jgi:hypothetical protein
MVHKAQALYLALYLLLAVGMALAGVWRVVLVVLEAVVELMPQEPEALELQVKVMLAVRDEMEHIILLVVAVVLGRLEIPKVVVIALIP